MGSQRLTNALLFVIAAALLAHIGLMLADRPVTAETFRLDSCITDKPQQKPDAYVHVVMHGVAETGIP